MQTPLWYPGAGARGGEWTPPVSRPAFLVTSVRGTPPLQVVSADVVQLKKIGPGLFSFDFGREVRLAGVFVCRAGHLLQRGLPSVLRSETNFFCARASYYARHVLET